MTIHYDFLQAKCPCTRTHHATINVFLQEDISLEENNNIQIKLPLAINAYGGFVGLATLDKSTVVLVQRKRDLYMTNSNDNGLIVTLNNKSKCYQRVDLKEGLKLLVLRYVE